MSSRHLKKVYGESQNDELKAKAGQVSDDEDNLPVQFNRKTVSENPYELLRVAEDGDGDANDDTNDERGNVQDESDEEVNNQTPKKKKKKRKGKNKQPKTFVSAATTPPTPQLGGNPQGIQIHHRLTKVKEQAQRPGSSFSQGNLFAIDTKYLNPEFELKQIFGSKVIMQELGKSGQAQRKSYRSLGRIVVPKDKWPSVASSGISMTLLEPKELGFEYFKFEHDSHYREIQKQFMKAVDSHDPENILSIVRVHPYHVDSQIQLSDLSKQSEDSQVAAELVEIALHTMELGMDSRFSVQSSNSRLEYKYQENRAFHILLYKHLTFIAQRACYRTALELSKILLNLDPTDPLCVTLAIDFYAIKSGEGLWLVNVYNLWNGTRNLCQLPNWSYSVALAQFLLSEDRSAASKPLKSKKALNAAASLSQSEKDSYAKQSDELLQYSILMFPLVLIPLLDKCGIQCDQRVRNHPYFNYCAQNSSTDALRLLCNLYVWRSHHLWKNPAILGWIEKNTYAVMQKIDRKDPVINDYDQKRKRRYKDGTMPRNVVRHILLTDEKDLTVNIPRELSKEGIVTYDPLPPRDSVDIYQREEPQVRLENDGSPGILNALLQSFGLDLNLRGPHENNIQLHVPVGNAEEEGEVGAEGAARALHQSVNVFVEAMRSLLAIATSDNLNAPVPAEETDSSDNDELPPLE